MALTTRLQLQTSAPQPVQVDITHNLNSLQFESALTDEQEQLLVLRARSHAITVSICAQTTYFVSILNESRNLRKRLKSPQRKTTKILNEGGDKDPLKIGILGCGRLGSQLAHCLLTYGRVDASDIKISTRRPETLEYLQSKGVECFFDNVRLIKSCHLVLLCILPAYLPLISEEVKAYVNSETLFYSFLSSVSVRKLKQSLNTSNILKPDFQWLIENAEKPWDYTVNVNTALERKDMVEKTCPLMSEYSECIVHTNEGFVECMVYALVNMLTCLKLNRSEIVKLLNTVLIGDRELLAKARVKTADFPLETDEEFLPLYDLVEIAERPTQLLSKFKQSEDIQKGFLKKYWKIYETYLHMRAYGQL